MSDTFDMSSAVFTKTELGQQEIQTRALGLSPLVRRILLLADGKKSGIELAAFLPNAQDIHAVLGELLNMGCLRVEGGHPPAAEPKPQSARAAPLADLVGLPPAEVRSAKDNEMARNFMVNSINSIIGQQMRISLIIDITDAQDTEALRRVYSAWQASMADHSIGKKRLPELTEKLFRVL